MLEGGRMLGLKAFLRANFSVRNFLIAEIMDFVAFSFFHLPSSIFLSPSAIPLGYAALELRKLWSACNVVRELKIEQALEGGSCETNSFIRRCFKSLSGDGNALEPPASIDSRTPVAGARTPLSA